MYHLIYRLMHQHNNQNPHNKIYNVDFLYVHEKQHHQDNQENFEIQKLKHQFDVEIKIHLKKILLILTIKNNEKMIYYLPILMENNM